MKKLLASVLMTSLATSAFASTSDFRSLIVQNNEQNESFSLNTETTRTVYRTETVPSTCYRQEITGYRRVCDGYYGSIVQNVNQIIGTVAVNDVGPHPAPGPHPNDPGREPKPRPNPSPTPRPEPRPQPRPEPRPEPRPIPRPEPRPEPRPIPRPEPRPEPRPIPRPPICHDEPIYTTVAYSCMQTISVPYEVVDHTSTANVNVKLSAAPTSLPQSSNCAITFRLDGDNFQSINSCSQYLAVAQIQGQNGGTTQNYNYQINLFDSAAVFAPLAGGMSNIHLDGDTLFVKTGNLASIQNFTLKIYVERKRFLKSDEVLINRALKASEFTYQAIDSHTGYARIDLSKLIDFESDKKNEIKVSLDVALPSGSIISGSVVPALHQEASMTTH